jgi:uncharacterized repeat protein (TIGR01451 family)
VNQDIFLFSNHPFVLSFVTFKIFYTMRPFNSLLSVLLLSTFYSFAQCPDGVEATLYSTGPMSCPCYHASATGGVSPYTYMWSNGQTNPDICNAPPGVYILTVTDANGCTDDTTVTILVSTSLSVTMSSTPALCTNGTATASVTGGTPPFTYLWSTIPPQVDSVATGLIANQYYYVTVSDDSGCTTNAYVNISTTSNLTSGISSTPDTCSHGVGALTGYAVSGIPPYSYHWNTGDTITTLINQSSGSYSFTVTDDSGCVSTSSVSLNNFSPLQVNHTDVNPSCIGANGSITLTANGGSPQYIYFWNTIPPQYTNAISNLDVGIYHCFITDQQGCEANVSVYLTDNSNFSASSFASPDTCGQGVGIATAVTFNGVPPFSYQWNNLAASPDSVLNNRTIGWNTCWITDDSGCVRKTNVYVGNYSPLTVYATPQNASCIFTADGSATAIVNGGTQPYTYTWTNGTGGSSVSGLLQGHYSVYVTDANGCAAYDDYIVGYDSISPCAVTIEGIVFNDTSGNCLKDPGELMISNVKIECMPLGGYKWTNVTGRYNYYLPPGNYSVTQYLPAWHTQMCPTGIYLDTLPVAGMIDTNNFADLGNAVDLDIDCYGINVPVPGFDFYQSVYYRNQGSQAVNNVTITVQHDPRIVFINSIPTASNYNSSTNTITIPVGNLNPFGNTALFQGDVVINYHVPDTLTIGTVLNFRDTIFPVAADTIVYNNSDNCSAIVSGPIDPNNITADPKGDGYNGYITTGDSIITYTVRFQNTGTWLAHNVVVEVQLDDDMDLSSFEMEGASSIYEVEISATGLAKVTFFNINLPDSNFDEAGSHGYFAFSMKQIAGLPENEQIVASANIYFDFNYPVATNDALNTILTSGAIEFSSGSVSISPNPSRGFFDVGIDLQKPSQVMIEFYDAIGNLLLKTDQVQMSHGSHTKRINTSGLSNGVYFVRVITDEGSVTSRAILY